MSMFESVIYIFIGFICSYAIIDRICKCIEYRNAAKIYQKFNEDASKAVVERVKAENDIS